MSATANWVYTNLATIYPRTYDDWKGIWLTGTPYLIDCTWEINQEQAIDDAGTEFTTNLIISTELKHNGADVRKPLRNDYVAVGDTTAEPDPVKAKGDVIRAVKMWDMSFFDEEPDYKILTSNRNSLGA